ncbi:MAG: hypothetical protein AAFX94_20905, partial [Myxococcota bacterium]
MGAALLAVLLFAQANSPVTEDPDPAEIEVLLVEDGIPIADAVLLVDGSEVARTDERGTLVTEIPAGRSKLTLKKESRLLAELDLLTDSGELVLVIATITEGQEPELLIESSGGDSALASSSATTQEKIEAAKKDQPPGALTGTVLSAAEKQPIPRAQLFFSGITIEVQTDKDGNFSVELPSGVYSVS